MHAANCVNAYMAMVSVQCRLVQICNKKNNNKQLKTVKMKILKFPTPTAGMEHEQRRKKNEMHLKRKPKSKIVPLCRVCMHQTHAIYHRMNKL